QVHRVTPGGSREVPGQAKPWSRAAGRRGRAVRSASVARVLIAEDDEGIRLPLVRALEREGYEVDAVGDGLEAEARALADGHDLLVLDIGLPCLDRLEVCPRARGAPPHVAGLVPAVSSGERGAGAGLDGG